MTTFINGHDEDGRRGGGGRDGKAGRGLIAVEWNAGEVTIGLTGSVLSENGENGIIGLGHAELVECTLVVVVVRVRVGIGVGTGFDC